MKFPEIMIGLVVIVFSVSIYSMASRYITQYESSHSKTCIEGVTYYMNGHRLAPAYNKDGSLKTCQEE